MIQKFYSGFIYFLNTISTINTSKFIASIVFLVLLYILRNTIIYLERRF